MDRNSCSLAWQQEEAKFLSKEQPVEDKKLTIRRFIRIATWSSFVAFILFYSIPNIFFSNNTEEPGHPRHPKHPHDPHHPDHPRNSRHSSPGHHGHHGGCEPPLTNAEVAQLMITWPDTQKLSEWSYYYTSGQHLAGKNKTQAEWTRDKWNEFGVKSDLATYNVYINYPLGHRLALYDNDKISFEASLQEDVLEDDPSTASPQSIPTFHGYSKSGNVTAQYVYVNYGVYQDFEDLIKAGVELTGKIAIARYGGIFRGLKAKRAQELGMIGAILYTDPGDDQGAPGREESSVQRGSVSFLSLGPGDPTTIGRPSLPNVNVTRDDPTDMIPSIPTIPISYRDALPILKALNGHGPAAKDINEWWTKNIGLEDKGVNYNIGPSPANLKLNLVNEQDYVYQDIWNTIGIINGTLPDEVIVVGNHRDAWIVGGAADPNSGSAALMEVVRGLGHAASKGWKPLRTIVFASWDGEEYGLLGSTEWVEEYIPWLSAAAVSYVNLDVGCSGPNFEASASPLLNQLIYEVTGMVQSPNQTIKGQTVKDTWNNKISTMGSGSDFTAFQDWAGIPSVDFGFVAGADSPVYHYHSNYDTYHWMNTSGDPGWLYHQAAARILGLFVTRLASAPLAPLNTTDYGTALKTYIQQLEDKLVAKEEPETLRTRPVVEVTAETNSSLASLHPILDDLQNSATEFKNAAVSFDAHVAELKEKAGDDIPWWKWWSKLKLIYDIKKANTQIKFLERQFLYEEGLDGREYFKHVIFAPGLWTGYAGGKHHGPGVMFECC